MGAKAVIALKTLIPMWSGQETNLSPIESQENTSDVQVKEVIIKDDTGEDTEGADEESVDKMKEIGEETGDTGKMKMKMKVKNQTLVKKTLKMNNKKRNGENSRKAICWKGM